jgi:hypothetical protein
LTPATNGERPAAFAASHTVSAPAVRPRAQQDLPLTGVVRERDSRNRIGLAPTWGFDLS